jgi:hypothetical protein
MLISKYDYRRLGAWRTSKTTCILHQWKRSEHTMRTVFTIEISTDVSIGDDKRRKAFVELMKKATRQLSAQTAMLSEHATVEINAQVEDSIHGTEEIELFGASK